MAEAVELEAETDWTEAGVTAERKLYFHVYCLMMNFAGL